MRCSRVALSLLLALFGGAVIALGPADGQQGVAADISPEQASYTDTWERADQGQGMADPQDDFAMDSEETWTNDPCHSDAVCEEGASAAYWQDDQFEYAYDDKEDAEEETEEDKDTYDYADCEAEYAEYYADQDDADLGSEVSDAEDEEYSYEYSEYESEYADYYGDGCLEEDGQVAEDTQTDTDTSEDNYSYEYDYEDAYAGQSDTDASEEDYTYDYDRSEYSYEDEYADEAETEASEEDYSYDYDQYDYNYEDEYADEAETEASEEDYSYDYDEYDYNYEDEYADEAETEASEEDYSYDYDQYDYNYEDEYADEAETEASEEDYSYDYDEYEYNYEDEYADEPETETSDEDYSYDYDEYEYNYEDEYADEPETEASEEDYSYEYDEYGHSGYESDYGEADEDGSYWDEQNQAAEDVDSSEPQAWEDQAGDDPAYEGYSDAYPEQEHAYVQDESDSTSAYEYEYEDEYEYSYPQQKYGYGEEMDYSPEYGDEQDDEAGESYESEEYHYGYTDDEYDYESEWTGDDEFVDQLHDGQTAASSDGELDLCAWRPGEVLFYSDTDLLRRLERLSEELPETRRTLLNDYLESLGWEAGDFVDRFVDTTGIDVLDLADDPPGAAALLVTFRLVERGDVDMDPAINMLWRGLEKLDREWLDQITEIIAPQPESDDFSAEKTSVLDVVLTWASSSLGDLDGVFRSLSGRVSDLRWGMDPSGT